MNFVDLYNSETNWGKKVIIMELFHLSHVVMREGWTIRRTAEEFHCSIGLTSENLRLAHAIHEKPEILDCETRQDALKKVNGRI